jgi:diacylglycerol kinase
VTDLARHEPTFKYFIIAFLLVLVAILYFEPTKAESAVLILAAVFVFTLEFINSLFERLLDIVEPKDDERVRHIKDVMAGLVLLASIGAALVGLIVLLPYAYALWVI